MTMLLKGVVVVSPAASPSASGDSPALQRVANRPIVCHVLDGLVAAGIDALAVVAPAEAMTEVRRCIESEPAGRVEIAYLPHAGRADLLGAVQAAAAFVGEDPSVAHFADGLLGQPLASFTAALTVDAPDLLLLLHRSADSRDHLGPAAQKLLGIAELNGSRNHLALAGVCLFGPGGLRRAAEATRDRGPAGDPIALAERLAAQGRALAAAFVHSWRRFCGNPADLLELNRLVLDQLAPQGEPPERGDNRIEGRVVLHPTAEVRSSTILGPSIIGANARVSNAYIGPYTSIDAEAEIEGAEIVRSIVAEGVRIMHVPERIEGSTIGRRASILRDFGLPRAMRLHVGEGVEIVLN
jgi:glucose-1-phosphate thymidylyltransferase